MVVPRGKVDDLLALDIEPLTADREYTRLTEALVSVDDDTSVVLTAFRVFEVCSGTMQY